MSVVSLGNNISALRVERQLADAGSQLSRNFERLSSGLRINSASDDAAGLSISALLNVDSRVYSQAVRNVSDAVGMANIAEGALQELRNISIRKLELAEQASNGTMSFNQRRALHAEANALVDEFNRIVASTGVNNLQIFDPTAAAPTVQLGYGSAASLSIDMVSGLQRTVGDGTFSAAGSAYSLGPTYGAYDFNKDGALDLLAQRGVALGNGDGTFKAWTTIESSSLSDLKTGDFDGDGDLDVYGYYTYLDIYESRMRSFFGVLISNGDGTFKSAVSNEVDYADPSIWNATAADLNRDGKLDIALSDTSANAVMVAFGNGDGSFRSLTENGIYGTARDVVAGDMNNDGITDLAAVSFTAVSILLGNGDGSFKARTTFTGVFTSGSSISVADFDNNGSLDLALWDSDSRTIDAAFGNGDGTFKTFTTVGAGGPGVIADINGDGLPDLVGAVNGGTPKGGVYLSNGDGTFRTAGSIALALNTSTKAAVDLNGDSVLDLISGDNVLFNSYVNLQFGLGQSVTTSAHINLTTAQGARDALVSLRAELIRVSSDIGKVGAAQSRLQTAFSTLQSARENFDAARSRITDADTADEAAGLVKAQILQQAGAAILGQASQAPALALRMLAGS